MMSSAKRPSRRVAWPLLAAALLLWSATAAALPPIHHWVTGNGARVYFVATHELSMVDVRVVFDAGAARDGAHPGIALLTNSLLEEGAGGLDADTIATRFDAVGARFSTDSLRDMALVQLRSLSPPAQLRPALATMATVLTRPDFPEKALARVRAQMRVALRNQAQSPAAVARKAFYRALYGDHPYGHPPLGDAASLKALDRAAVAAFYRRYYVGRNAVVAIVGDLDTAAAHALAEQVVGGLPAGTSPPALPPVPELKAAKRIHVDFPSAQTHILIGAPGIARGDPDYYALYVGNYILGGGGLVSRLSSEVREKRGLAYSTHSRFLPMHRRGPFIMGAETRNERAAQSLKVMRETLARFVAGGPTPQELAAAKRHLTGGFPLQVASNRDIAANLAMIGFYRLPADYLRRWPQRMGAVSRAQVRAAFRRHLDTARLLTVTVGPAS